jgi:hypothetical protein
MIFSRRSFICPIPRPIHNREIKKAKSGNKSGGIIPARLQLISPMSLMLNEMTMFVTGNHERYIPNFALANRSIKEDLENKLGRLSKCA